jgi:hypothetical protein
MPAHRPVHHSSTKVEVPKGRMMVKLLWVWVGDLIVGGSYTQFIDQHRFSDVD